MLDHLKKAVLEANLSLSRHGLATFTWGNASAIDRETGRMVIKPSGVPYDKLKAQDMVVVDLDGRVVEGRLNPSSDTPTHLVLYRALQELGGIVHTHSEWATAWAQAGRGIPVCGTTHADYFFGEIPCTRGLTGQETAGDYETETGNVIVETLRSANKNPKQMPGILVRNHGPFTWGRSADEAVFHSVVLNEIAKLAYRTFALNQAPAPVPQFLLDKHYLRKHGKDAYYGQPPSGQHPSG